MDKARLRVIDIFSKNVFHGSFQMEKKKSRYFCCNTPKFKAEYFDTEGGLCVYIYTL